MYHIDVRRRSFQPRVSSSHILHLIVFSWSTLHVAIRVPHSRRSFQPRVSSSHILHLIVFSWSRHTLHVAIRVPHSISSCCFPPTITGAGDIADTAILRPTCLGICCEHHQARKICVILVATVSEGTVFHL